MTAWIPYRAPYGRWTYRTWRTCGVCGLLITPGQLSREIEGGPNPWQPLTHWHCANLWEIESSPVEVAP